MAAQDPLSHVASWLTPASADATVAPTPTAAGDTDPVLALIAEEKQLDEEGLRGGCIDDGLINAAIAGLRDMQPEASPISPGSRILSLFREWVEAKRADRGEEDDALAERVDDIEREINSLPAIGAADLAIKTYLYIHGDDEGWRADPAALSGCDKWELEHKDTDPRRPLVRDILSFVPELYPLVADYLNLVPSQCWITALTKVFISIPQAEKRRRGDIVGAECSELCEKIWRERPITSADYQVIVSQVIARHPDWFETAEERAEAERQAEAERKAERKAAVNCLLRWATTSDVIGFGEPEARP